ncbi:DUF2218 domain-containing protein [Tropicimonas sp. TH_r6]|uniref:DUF2218 domain-containing protein n=1 Tax=Tropicimonas sp. TH_r6 TaxID=3082085 RepID=UPI002952E67B|nr:DUF2218 domain-containing protein [Tropicimonas sp. TH_r6]MDV7143606.1 DUF2218 domain-containing protein [Tropicimonas sp. TH_r6]
MKSFAQLETAKGAQYMASLCKHFGRKVPAQNDGTTGRVEFPFGRCDLKADESHLELLASADTQADLDKTAEVIGSHLERFAFRENPRIDWGPARQT